MPMPDWATVAVTIERPATKEARGARVPDQSATTTRMTLFAPPGTDVRRGDRVTYAGTRYAIDGEPIRYPSPLGGLDHIECSLVDWG